MKFMVKVNNDNCSRCYYCEILMVVGGVVFDGVIWDIDGIINQVVIILSVVSFVNIRYV